MVLNRTTQWDEAEESFVESHRLDALADTTQFYVVNGLMQEPLMRGLAVGHVQVSSGPSFGNVSILQRGLVALSHHGGAH